MADLKEVQAAIMRDFADAVAKIPQPKAGYAAAQHYAAKVGRALTAAMRKHIGADVLVDGMLTKEAAGALVKDPLSRGWEIVSSATAEIQTALNKRAGVSIRGATAAVNKGRVDGMVGLMTGDEYQKLTPMLGQCADNIMRASVDTTAWRNAAINSGVGLEMTVERIPDEGACEWCLERAGVFNYDEVKDRGSPVWERHRDCGCIITTSVRRSRR